MTTYQSDQEKYKLSIEGVTTQPVYDRELELDTLACIVFNDKNYSKVTLLNKDDFYSVDTQKMFAAIRDNYEMDKVINVSSLDSNIKQSECYLSVHNSRNYVITAQVDFNIKKLREISGARKIQDLCYKTTVKIEEKQPPEMVKAWFITEAEKITTGYGIQEITIELLDDMFEKFVTSVLEQTTKSGFPKFDRTTGGFPNGSMTIIASAPSIGKTTFAINILNHVCGKLGKAILFVSLEMSFVHLYIKMISSLAGVSFHKATCRKNELTEGEWVAINNARAKISSYRLAMIGEKEIGLTDIREALKKTKADMVIIDYLQLLKPPVSGSLYETTTNLSRSLKVLANEFNIPFLVISSINRDYSDRNDMTPRISDIRHSGQIEYDADLILLLHRDSAFREFDSSKDKDEFIFNHSAELTIAKSRLGESNVSIDFYFDGERALFREMESHVPE